MLQKAVQPKEFSRNVLPGQAKTIDVIVGSLGGDPNRSKSVINRPIDPRPAKLGPLRLEEKSPGNMS